ncbi:LysR substrate-binding domain-containing protein [Methylobacterium nonmethylotrophicum]|uniref:LysR family transcriptional regulator n=1 Tax=Methylobacterium nonmethylotrophicum TaxID=1141884 RepID=A0A4Z0NX67_9HYPH|nr:LysR substrate-binding domain-containing protein [Methylobacterium nonmethylotrophicum]TGE02255.1 LysR family transcriptional regulator [Methylobacterium nonmethylotrophicum]
MELRHLRYFVAVAESLSFTAAAERLGVSQPPLSQQIRDLEAELGTPLLWRTSRRVALTPAGTAFLARARAILAEVEAACAEVRAIGAGRSGTLDIGLTGSILAGPLGRLIRLFGERHPSVLVRLHEMAPGEQPAALHARRTDLGFLRRPPDDPSLRVVRAWPEAVGVALPAGHRLASRPAITLADLRDEAYLSLRLHDSRFARDLWDACLAAGFAPRLVQQVVESASLVNLVAAGLGVALVPESIGIVPRPDIVYRPLAGPAPVADVCALHRVPAGPVAENFLALMRSEFGRADGPAAS